MLQMNLDIREQLLLIEKSVNIKEHRHTLRVIRVLPSTRKKLNRNVFALLMKLYFNGRFPTDDQRKQEIASDLNLVTVVYW